MPKVKVRLFRRTRSDAVSLTVLPKAGQHLPLIEQSRESEHRLVRPHGYVIGLRGWPHLFGAQHFHINRSGGNVPYGSATRKNSESDCSPSSGEMHSLKADTFLTCSVHFFRSSFGV